VISTHAIDTYIVIFKSGSFYGKRRNSTRMNTDEMDFHGFKINALSVLIRSIRVNPRAIIGLELFSRISMPVIHKPTGRS
jgi:hypothetical protein